MSAPISIKNASTGTVTVLGQDITANQTFEVPLASVVSWACDAWLRFNIERMYCVVFIYDQQVDVETATRWLSQIATGEIVIQ